MDTSSPRHGGYTSRHKGQHALDLRPAPSPPTSSASLRRLVWLIRLPVNAFLPLTSRPTHLSPQVLSAEEGYNSFMAFIASHRAIDIEFLLAVEAVKEVR